MLLAIDTSSLVLSCALGWVAAKISQKLRNKSLVVVLASLVSTPLLAGEHDHRRTPTAERNLQDMRPVPTSVSAQEPGYGWQYFSDPATHHAVVISPQGDYYFSRGKGLHWVASAQSGA